MSTSSAGRGYRSQGEGFRCEQCNAPLLTTLFCGACHSTFPARLSASHFTQLNLPETFFLDEDELEQRVTRAATLLHPDRYLDADEKLRRRLGLYATTVNEAARTLQDPILRARYLLSRMPEWAQLADNKSTPPGFLIEQLELREELEEGVDEQRARVLKRQLRRTLKGIGRELEGHFAQLEGREGPAAQGEQRDRVLAAVKVQINISKYFRNALEVLRH